MISKECEVKDCNKVIEGYTIKQVEYLMRQHILAKHNNLHIKELIKEDNER